MDDPALILPVIANEFDGVDATDIIALAEIQIKQGFCGNKRPLLVAYLAAHMLTISERSGGSTGGLTSIKEGQLSKGFSGGGANGGTGLHSTSYGQEYDRMSRACAFSVMTRVSHGAW